jgi:hypothetical protein
MHFQQQTTPFAGFPVNISAHSKTYRKPVFTKLFQNRQISGPNGHEFRIDISWFSSVHQALKCSPLVLYPFEIQDPNVVYNYDYSSYTHQEIFDLGRWIDGELLVSQDYLTKIIMKHQNKVVFSMRVFLNLFLNSGTRNNVTCTYNTRPATITIYDDKKSATARGSAVSAQCTQLGALNEIIFKCNSWNIKMLFTKISSFRSSGAMDNQ